MKRFIALFSFLILFTGCNSLFNNNDDSQVLEWVQVESAESQCMTPEYASLEEAVDELEENGITVFDSDEDAYPVCAACGCPTGILYQAQIDEDDVDKATELGWGTLDEGNDTPD